MNFTFSEFLFVLGLTLFAGLATGIGGAISFFVKKTNTKFLTFSLGLSGGVMVYISFMELLATAKLQLGKIHGESAGHWWALAAFFGGVFLAVLIDKLVPEDENPHEARSLSTQNAPELKTQDLSFSDPSSSLSKQKIHRSGLLFALAIGIHNFPEGLATMAAGLNSASVGISIAIAVALHNIPEGIAVSVPIYYGTGDRKKAFWYSLLAGLAEPVGAVLGMVVLYPFMTPTLLALLFAGVAGIMVFISFDELLPMSERWGHHHLSIYGIICGMALMAMTLALI